MQTDQYHNLAVGIVDGVHAVIEQCGPRTSSSPGEAAAVFFLLLWVLFNIFYQAAMVAKLLEEGNLVDEVKTETFEVHPMSFYGLFVAILLNSNFRRLVKIR